MMSLMKTRFPCDSCEILRSLIRARLHQSSRERGVVDLKMNRAVKGTRSHLISLALKSLEDGVIGRFGKARGFSCFFIVLIPNAHPFWSANVRIDCNCSSANLPIVESIPKWLVYTSKIFPRHKYLSWSTRCFRRETTQHYSLEGCRAGTWVRDAEYWFWLLRHGWWLNVS